MEVEARIVRLQLAETFVIAREATDDADVVHVAVTHDGIDRLRRGGAGRALRRVDASRRSPSSRSTDGSSATTRSRSRTSASGSRSIPGEQAAKSALDAALHDLQGKLLGVPRCRLLGLPRTGPPTSWTVWLGDPDDMARRAEQAARRYRRLKLKLGGGTGSTSSACAPSAAPPTLPLQVDVNEWWSLDEALDALPQLAELGVEYCEQPLRAGDEGGPS